MQLNLFGKVHLENSTFSRPKPLLILSYLTLEGAQDRRKLADLFWQDAASQTDAKKALQKKLGKLSVVLAQFKKSDAKEVFNFEAGLDPLESQATTDTQAFLEAVDQKDFQKAVALYKGAFLEDIGKNLDKLDAQATIKEWVLDRREYFASKAQLAMIALAEQRQQNGNTLEAKQLAERAYNLKEAPEPEPQTLNRLNKVLSATGSELEDKLENQVEASLEELGQISLKVFLALALQDKTNLTVVKNALKLSLSETDEAREELIINGLLSPDTQILAQGLARNWLVERPTERMPLLLALARNTPAEKAYSLYQRIYEKTHGFGGMGDLKKARQAYCKRAQELIDARDYALAVSLMEDARKVEEVLDAEPDTECRFIEAYARERQGQYKEAIELINALNEQDFNPNVIALRSVLLWRTGKSEEAEIEANKALESGLDWLWAKAVANNTLGYLTFSEDKLLDAASYFRKSAGFFKTANEKIRWVGSLSNYAIVLDEMAVEAEVKKKNNVDELTANAENAFQEALNVLETSGEDKAMEARLLINMGMFWERRKNWDNASDYYLKAKAILDKHEFIDLSARLFSNLGMVYLKKNELENAKESFSAAVDYASQAGEYLIQGSALANLAFIEQDEDSMEVALELLEKSGSDERHNFYLNDYLTIIKTKLENALTSNNANYAQRLFKKLGWIYRKLDDAKGIAKVEEALTAIETITELEQNKDLLMAYIDTTNESTKFVN